jgi:basic membrane lipoprotein Med (substrate-binding protein (PBP1-ABC) superfamily)
MVFAFEDPSYLAGLVAGSMTKTGIVGTIGGTELPPVKSSFVAFERGVHAANPRAKVLSSFIGNWNDAAAGKEQALAQIAQGADLIFQNADAAGLGIFQAAREKKGVWVFGSNSNQNEVAPDVVIGSVVIDLPHAFLTVAREVKEKRFKPRVIELGTASDVVTYVPNPAFDSIVPAAVRAKVDSARLQLRAGTLTVSPSGAD